MGRIPQTSQAVDTSVGFASSTEFVTRIAYESILPDSSFQGKPFIHDTKSELLNVLMRILNFP